MFNEQETAAKLLIATTTDQIVWTDDESGNPTATLGDFVVESTNPTYNEFIVRRRARSYQIAGTQVTEPTNIYTGRFNDRDLWGAVQAQIMRSRLTAGTDFASTLGTILVPTPQV